MAARLPRVTEQALTVVQPLTPDRSWGVLKRDRKGRAVTAFDRDWNPVALSLALALFFAVLALVKASSLGLAVAILFVVVVVIAALWL